MGDVLHSEAPDFYEERWDPEVERLCIKHGWGAVFQSVARQWSGRDPSGALTVGPPVRLNCEERNVWLAENGEKILEVLELAQLGMDIRQLSVGVSPAIQGRDEARIRALREIVERFRGLVKP